MGIHQHHAASSMAMQHLLTHSTDMLLNNQKCLYVRHKLLDLCDLIFFVDEWISKNKYKNLEASK